MKAYTRGNKFSYRINVADAAVDWAGLGAEEWPRVYLDDDNLPMHPERVGLPERASGLLAAAHNREIVGSTHTENGQPLGIEHIRLERESVLSWVGTRQ